MEILVCVKQVPDIGGIEVHPSTREDSQCIECKDVHMNRCDEFALEEALRLKESFNKIHIDALTVGAEDDLEVVRRAIGMGVDSGVLLKSTNRIACDPVTVSNWIGRYVRDRDYTLVLCGSMSEDGMYGQVGPMIAGHLDWPCASQVIALQPIREGRALYLEREIEGGIREMLEIEIPAVLTVQSGINRPRYPSLSNLMRATKMTIPVIETGALGSPKTTMIWKKSTLPNRSRKSIFLTGSARQKADRFIDLMQEKAFLC